MSETVCEQWFRRVWNELDTDAIDDLFAADGLAYGIYGQEIRGPGEFREFHAVFAGLFSDIHIDVVEEVASGDHVAIRCNGEMTHRASGKRCALNGTGFLVIRDGQIVTAWNHWDFLDLLEDMGLLPHRSFELAITGQLDPHPQASSS